MLSIYLSIAHTDIYLKKSPLNEPAESVIFSITFLKDKSNHWKGKGGLVALHFSSVHLRA